MASPPRIDLTGKKFDRWTVLGPSSRIVAIEKDEYTESIFKLMKGSSMVLRITFTSGDRLPDSSRPLVPRLIHEISPA